MTIGLLGNKSFDSDRLILVTPKSENDVRLQAKLENQNPTENPWDSQAEAKLKSGLTNTSLVE